MTQNIIAFDYNGVNVLFDENTAILTLTTAPTLGTLSFHDSRDNSNYQVPVGKKARVIFIISAIFSGAGDRVIYADDADGTTNAVTLYEPGRDVTNEIFISASVPEGKFINRTENGNTATIIAIVEESAT